MKKISDILNQHPEISCTYTETSLIFSKPDTFLVLKSGDDFISVKDSQVFSRTSRYLSLAVALALKKLDVPVLYIDSLFDFDNLAEMILPEIKSLPHPPTLVSFSGDEIVLRFMGSKVFVKARSLESFDVFDDYSLGVGSSFREAWISYLEKSKNRKMDLARDIGDILTELRS